jgi:hypothetical protein
MTSEFYYLVITSKAEKLIYVAGEHTTGLTIFKREETEESAY